MIARILRAGIAVVVVALGCAGGPISANDQLDRRIESQYPIELSAQPAERATRAGLLRVSQAADVLMGFEEATTPLRRGVVPPDLRGMTVREALDALTQFDGRYRWRAFGDVAVVRPVEAWNDCSHYLNRHVSVSRDGLQMSSAIFMLFSLIDPAVPEPPKPPPQTMPQRAPIRVNVQDASLLEVLNEIARNGRMSWEISYGPRSGGGRPTSITLREVDGIRTGFTSPLNPMPAECAR